MTEPAATPKRIIVLASYQYLNYIAVLAYLTKLAAIDPTEFDIASQIGIGHSLLKRHPNEHSLSVHPLKWQPTRPRLEVHADAAVVFWDGIDKSLLPSVVILRKASVSVSIIGPDGNEVALSTFCATLTSGKGPTMATPATTPTVIVDAPLSPHDKSTKVNVRIGIPEFVYQLYEAQAKAAKQLPEKIMADRLRTCVDHTSGRGLYFNDEQRSHLERITGGHIISDAKTALDKVRTVVNLKVGDITVELNDRILARATSRAKSVRKSLEEFIRKEVTEGLERSVGLRPW